MHLCVVARVIAIHHHWLCRHYHHHHHHINQHLVNAHSVAHRCIMYNCIQISDSTLAMAYVGESWERLGLAYNVRRT